VRTKNEYNCLRILSTAFFDSNTRVSFILDAFEKLQRATINFFMSARPSYARNNLATTIRIVLKFYIQIFFEKSIEKFNVGEFFENLSRNFKFNQNLIRIT